MGRQRHVLNLLNIQLKELFVHKCDDKSQKQQESQKKPVLLSIFILIPCSYYVHDCFAIAHTIIIRSKVLRIQAEKERTTLDFSLLT